MQLQEFPLTLKFAGGIETKMDSKAVRSLYILRSARHAGVNPDRLIGLAEAIQRLWPEAKLAYGPPLENGFYYDIALATPISSNDFPKIEEEMQRIAVPMIGAMWCSQCDSNSMSRSTTISS